MTEQPVYELRPLFDVFTAAGEGWASDAAVTAELKRQGLRVEIKPNGFLYLWPSDTSDQTYIVLHHQRIDAETRQGVEYGYDSYGEYSVSVEDCRYNGVGLLPFMDVHNELARLMRLIERIKDANAIKVSH